MGRFNLKDKRILVTGASSGIGAAAAILFAKAGAKLTVSGRHADRLKGTVVSLAGKGHSSLLLDLEDTDGIAKAIKTHCKEYGALNGMFHAAGVESIKPINIIKDKDLQSVFASSIGASLMLAKAMTLKGVKAEGSTSLVFMSSVAGAIGQPGLSAYSASKGAVDAAVRSLAAELAPKQIRVNSLVAGAVQTDMHARITKDLPEQSIKDYADKHLFGFGEPSDIACAAQYLLSDASKWVTGTSLVVDGGYTCQ
jgi:NAD(P)-dependent dehydrogenase (short-subunit alcohol dehydrogenase family)